jgi:transposase
MIKSPVAHLVTSCLRTVRGDAASKQYTRSGKVYSYTAQRKRQIEFIAFLEKLEREIEVSITKIYIVLDNLRMHKGQQIAAWLAHHPRFVFQYPPVHCSWMNQVEQWFSILQRKRLRIANFANIEELAARLEAFVAEWNERAQPFKWNSQSAAKVLAKYEKASVNRALVEEEKSEKKAAEAGRVTPTPLAKGGVKLAVSPPVKKVEKAEDIKRNWDYALVA